jgi:hypothetical protein
LAWYPHSLSADGGRALLPQFVIGGRFEMLFDTFELTLEPRM